MTFGATTCLLSHCVPGAWGHRDENLGKLAVVGKAWGVEAAAKLALLLQLGLCTHACVCLRQEAGFHTGRAQGPQGLSLLTCVQGSPDHGPLSGPTAQPSLPTFPGTAALPSHPSGFCCIPVSHSPNKPCEGKKGAGEGEERP